MFQIDTRGRTSIYEQIVNGFKELIVTGILKTDEKLPSIRELSKTFTVNPNTIQKSYRELERQGYIYAVVGLGSFVSAIDDQRVDEKKLEEVKENMRSCLAEFLYLNLNKTKTLNIIKQLMEERSNWND